MSDFTYPDAQEPTISGEGDNTIEKHPAYAQITAGRVSGMTFLYGSDFKHQNHVRLQIQTSDLRRGHSGDWPNAHHPNLIEVSMSEAQWAGLVSSLNQGNGTQCTLVYTEERGYIPPIARPKDRKSQFGKEMVERLDIATQALDELNAQLDTCALSGKKKDALRSKIHTARMNINSNLSFVAKRFGEHMEDVTIKAKSEVDAYAQHTLGKLAQVTLSGGVDSKPLLLEAPFIEGEDNA